MPYLLCMRLNWLNSGCNVRLCHKYSHQTGSLIFAFAYVKVCPCVYAKDKTTYNANVYQSFMCGNGKSRHVGRGGGGRCFFYLPREAMAGTRTGRGSVPEYLRKPIPTCDFPGGSGPPPPLDPPVSLMYP